MSKSKVIGLLFGLIALVYYLTEDKPVVIETMDEVNKMIPIVMKYDDVLVPLHIESGCTTNEECLNHSLSVMSDSYGDLNKTMPRHVNVNSIVCHDQCIVDFSDEILEFDPKNEHQIEQVIGYLLNEYNLDAVTVEGKEIENLSFDDRVYLNRTNFLEQDYHRGYLYQMYMLKEISDAMLAIPVVVHMNIDDPIEAIETYYRCNASVQFDNLSFQKVEILEGNPMSLHLSNECMNHAQLQDEMILPILYSLQHIFQDSKVDVYVNDVCVQNVDLNELEINEFTLSQ